MINLATHELWSKDFELQIQTKSENIVATSKIITIVRQTLYCYVMCKINTFQNTNGNLFIYLVNHLILKL